MGHTMATEQYLVIALLVIAAAFLTRRLVAAAYAWKYHGMMLVTCPENHKPAAVKVATARAALHEFIKRGHLELGDCSRFHGRPDCDQDCLREIEDSPAEHRVWNIASQWFQGKQCVYCHKPIEPPSHIDHAPALMRIVDRKTVEWKNLPAEELPNAFAECVPVCWSCHMTETFLRKFPEKAVVRPWQH